MTTPTRRVTVKCPDCDRVYSDVPAPSAAAAGLDDYVDEGSSATCPYCGFHVDSEYLAERADGVESVTRRRFGAGGGTARPEALVRARAD